MENRAHALIAGLFTLLLGAALVVVALWFGKDEIPFAHYRITTTNSVAGLKMDAPVRYRGVEVGRVELIRIEPGLSGRIQIHIGVDKNTPVTTSTYAQLGYQGVTGLAFVTLNDDGSSTKLLREGGGEPEIALRRSLLDSGADILASVGEVADRINSLLDDDNQTKVKQTLAGMELAAQNSAVLLANARGTVAKAEQLMAKLEERVKTLDSVAASVGEVGAAARSVNEETVPRLNALVDQLNRETRALDRVLNTLGDNPQSMVFGAPRGDPGPGEPGFSPKGR